MYLVQNVHQSELDIARNKCLNSLHTLQVRALLRYVGVVCCITQELL